MNTHTYDISDFTLPYPNTQDEILAVSKNGRRAVVSYLVPDADPCNPRREWDNLGTMACFHNRYNLGDKYVPTLEEVQDIEKNLRDYISLPLYLYDHSGLTISTDSFSCPWDSGRIGLIFISKEKVRKEYGWKVITKERRDKIISYLEGEVETYDTFLTGDVYGVCHCTFTNAADPEDTPEWEEDERDECWGFYGNRYAEEEMKSGHESWKLEIEKNAKNCG